MLSQDISVIIDKIPWRIAFAGIGFHKADIITIRHKTDILTVTFICIYKSVFRCNAADLFLFHGSQRKTGMRQLLLCHRIQDIALVLIWINSFFQ